MNRRDALRLAGRLGPALTLATLAAGCGRPDDPTADRYHHGELAIGTGNTTGVFYEIGAGYADLISRNLAGYQAVAAPTAGSVDNLTRLGTGDLDLALVLADNAADAATGTGVFAGKPIPLAALARLYSNDLHVVARIDAHLTDIADLRGHRVSTGPAGSGTVVLANRVLVAAGLDPATDIAAVPASLPEATAGLAAGEIDALFWSGGLPTPGITDLFAKAGDKVRFLATDSLVPALQQRYGAEVYARAVIPAETYGTPHDTPTLAQPNLLVVRADLPSGLAFDLTGLLYAHQADLVAIHPAAKAINRTDGPRTTPVPLANGAQRYYRTG